MYAPATKHTHIWSHSARHRQARWNAVAAAANCRGEVSKVLSAADDGTDTTTHSEQQQSAFRTALRGSANEQAMLLCGHWRGKVFADGKGEAVRGARRTVVVEWHKVERCYWLTDWLHVSDWKWSQRAALGASRAQRGRQWTSTKNQNCQQATDNKQQTSKK